MNRRTFAKVRTLFSVSLRSFTTLYQGTVAFYNGKYVLKEYTLYINMGVGDSNGMPRDRSRENPGEKNQGMSRK
jgi:hypothetical protein